MARAKTGVRLAEIMGPVTPEDLTTLDTEWGSKAPPLQKPRQAHHNLARLLAGGYPEGEAGVVCGFVPSRVSMLKQDPTFRELLAFYAKQKDDVFSDVMTLMRSNATDILLELRERLMEKPEELTTADLLALLNSHMDRLGYAPVQKSIQVHATGGDAIAALKARADAMATPVRIVNRRLGATLQADPAPAALGGGESGAVVELAAARGEGGGFEISGPGYEVLDQILP